MGRLARIAAVLLAAIIVAASPLKAEWQRAANKHFTIYADMEADDLRRFADRLERFDAALRFITKARETTPVTIYVVNNYDEVRKLAGSRSVGGFYRGQAQQPFVVVPLSTGPEHSYSISAEDVLFHEYAHHMLLSNNDQFLPAWANEGMAEFFMSADLESDGSIVLGAPNRSRYFSMLTMSRWTARELLLSETREIPRKEIDQRYARGWLLIHYLFLSGERPNQFTQYITKLNEGVPIEKAATAVFGDLDKLDRDLERYVKRSKFQGLRVNKKQLSGTDKVTITPLTEGAAAIMPHRIVSANGVTPDMARSLVAKARGVAARYPNDAFAQRALAEMEYDTQNYAATVAAADRAIAVDPGNVMAMVYKGRVFARRAISEKKPELWKEARSWFLKANRANPDHAMPFVSYYDSFVVAGEKPTEGAITGLLRAITLVPQDASLHVRVGLLRLHQNDLTGARTILGVAAFDPSPAEKNPARDAVRMMDEGATAKEILAKFEQDLTISDFAVPEPPPEEK